MTVGDSVYRQIQSKARSVAAKQGGGAPTAQYLTFYVLESFLDRLTRTEHRDDFILKGGILLAVYGVRRPTKDVDSEAVSATVTPDHIAEVLRDVAAVDADDGLVFDLDTLRIDQIREHADHPGLRVQVTTHLGTHRATVAWDISTGDPIVPAPKRVTVPRILGGEIEVLGYAPETTIAEKGVTILERGTTSTRWRDYVDIVQLAEQHGIDEDELLESARAVARYRKVELGPVSTVVDGYGAIGQKKWAAWRRKEKVEAISAENLDDQMVRVAAILDPVFARGPGDDVQRRS